MSSPGVRCDRCGRENPDHLTFCEDCGFALGKGRRDAPAIAGTVAVPAPAAAPAQRPPAPAFALGTAPLARSAPVDPGPRCPACQTRNEPGHRFCIACGSSIEPRPEHAEHATVGAIAPQPAPQPAPAPFQVPYPPGVQNPITSPEPVAANAVARQSSAPGPATAYAPQPIAPMAPAPMVRLEPEAAPAVRPAACPRCHGANDGVALYCRTCGFPLGAAAAGAASGAPTPPDGLRDTSPQTHAPAHAQPRPFGGTMVIDNLPAAPTGSPASSGPSTVPTAAPSFADDAAARTGTFAPPVSTARSGSRLVMVAKDGTDGESWPIPEAGFDIGAREGTIQLADDPFLSSRHARLTREADGSWSVQDLASVNGVYLRLREPRPLSDGDLILFGQQVLRFEVVMDAEQGLRPATQHGTALFGTPQAPRLARLCQRTVEGITRDVFHIHRAETSLGRETADIVFTDDPFLSRRHAVIRHDPATGRFMVEDLGSSNGTFVAIRGRAPLSDGDILRMGLHMFRVELGKTAARSPTAAPTGASTEHARA